MGGVLWVLCYGCVLWVVILDGVLLVVCYGCCAMACENLIILCSKEVKKIVVKLLILNAWFVVNMANIIIHTFLD